MINALKILLVLPSKKELRIAMGLKAAMADSFSSLVFLLGTEGC